MTDNVCVCIYIHSQIYISMFPKRLVTNMHIYIPERVGNLNLNIMIVLLGYRYEKLCTSHTLNSRQFLQDVTLPSLMTEYLNITICLMHWPLIKGNSSL